MICDVKLRDSRPNDCQIMLAYFARKLAYFVRKKKKSIFINFTIRNLHYGHDVILEMKSILRLFDKLIQKALFYLFRVSVLYFR